MYNCCSNNKDIWGNFKICILPSHFFCFRSLELAYGGIVRIFWRKKPPQTLLNLLLIREERQNRFHADIININT